MPEAVVGAGTLLAPQMVKDAKAAGAVFGVAPGFDPVVLAAAKTEGLPMCPGIATASELSQALTAGCKMVKFFPAEAAGGVKMIKNLLGGVNKGIQWVVLTNGVEWRLYRLKFEKPVTWDLVVRFNCHTSKRNTPNDTDDTPAFRAESQFHARIFDRTSSVAHS